MGSEDGNVTIWQLALYILSQCPVAVLFQMINQLDGCIRAGKTTKYVRRGTPWKGRVITGLANLQHICMKNAFSTGQLWTDLYKGMVCSHRGVCITLERLSSLSKCVLEYTVGTRNLQDASKYLHSHTLAFAVLNKYYPPFFKIWFQLLSQHHQTLLPPSSSSFWIHNATCKNTKEGMCSLEVCPFWVIAAAFQDS